MPLIKSCDLAAYRANIETEIKAGRDPKQAVAIAQDTLRQACSDEGKAVPRTDGVETELGLDVVSRFDFSPLGKARTTPQGFLRFDANLTKVGVLKYKRADGSIQRELRHPDEVFDEASLSTLSACPVTDLHQDMVGPKNVRQLSVGIVGEQIKHDSEFVQGHVTIQDADTIQKVEKGDRKEVSPGYFCKLDRTPGEYNGERYDAIQRGIRYNHLAIGPTGWGRSGSEVALRLDGDAAASLEGDFPKEKRTMRKIRIDGIEYELDSDSGQQAVEQAMEKKDGQLKEQADEISNLKGRLDGSEKKVADLEKQLEEANDTGRLDALVNERATLVSQAKEVLGEDVKLDGLTAQEIKVKVLQKLDEEFKADGLEEAYINGLYDQSLKSHKSERADGNAAARTASPGGKKKEGEDEEDRFDSAKAYQRMVERNQKAWRPEDSAS